MAATLPRVFAAADTGGTFTDITVWNGGRVTALKVPSTPHDPAAAVIAGLEAAGALPGATAIIHGTTVATNALLTGNLAPTVLVTTAGFEDVIEIGRQDRPELYALEVHPRPQLIARQARIGVHERILADGSVHVELTDAGMARTVRAVTAQKPGAVAIVLLHAYANPTHEQRLRDALAAAFAGQDVFITAACDVYPEFREYERTATLAVNAACGPVMGRYLRGLATRAQPSPLFVMQSNGGFMTAARAAREPVQTVLSGPAGGVLGALRLGEATGRNRLITFDMGGTSTDVCLIDRAVPLTAGTVIGGWPIRVPAAEIHTAGAGGGSIAWRDAGGALRAGPQSAGALPGPACYGRGGPPCATDAHVLLGNLGDSLLDGAFKLDARASQRALATLGRALKLTATATAHGILGVINAIMAQAIRRISLDRGYFPGDFTLVSFGGAGGLHAARLAEALGIREVLIPVHPGAMCALGMLGAAPRASASRTVLQPFDGAPPAPGAPLEAALSATADAARDALGTLATAAPADIAHFLDLRYAGESHELTVAAGPGAPARFEALHEQRYGTRHPGTPLELVAVRAWASAPPFVTGVFAGGLAPAPGPGAFPTPSTRPVDFGRGPQPTAVIHRASLAPGSAVHGPAVITEYSGTALLPPGWQCETLRHGHLLFTQRP